MLEAAQAVADELISSIESHLAVQAVAGVRDALSLGGGTLVDHLGHTFLYDSPSGEYGMDASRRDAPPDAVRFALYTLEDD